MNDGAEGQVPCPWADAVGVASISRLCSAQPQPCRNSSWTMWSSALSRKTLVRLNRCGPFYLTCSQSCTNRDLHRVFIIARQAANSLCFLHVPESRVKVEAASQLRDNLDAFTTGNNYAVFLKRLMPIFVNILNGPCIFQSTSNEQVRTQCCPALEMQAELMMAPSYRN